MNEALRYLGQALAYALFAVVLGYFSTSPAYQQLPADYALIKLSFSHAAQRKQPCRQRSPEELAKLPQNMRIAMDCPRERSNVVVEMDMDGQGLYHVVLPPSGVAHDGASSVYRRLPVRAGPHRLVLRLKDTEQGDFGFVREQTVTLEPGHVMVIDFKSNAPGAGGWMFHGGGQP
ncbi:MAG TPA: hypothetical protein VEE84_05790 [Burkholderiaceae bacterium]|nr:hypothetical protein [Burkholderiaceae bacterium]